MVLRSSLSISLWKTRKYSLTPSEAMSPDSYQLFSTWFPAIVVGLIIGLLAAALWDLLRRKTWCFASRFWPGILTEVGLDNFSLSRAEVEKNQREVTEKLSALASHISSLVPVKSPMAETAASTAAESSIFNSSVSSNCTGTGDFDLEAQTEINPLHATRVNPINFTVTAYFRNATPLVVIRSTKKFFNRYAKGTVKRWKSSVILQASLPIEPCVLAEIGELAKHCMHIENRCTFQLGNWAILYYNAGEVHLHMLKEGDVPVNVEARWQAQRAGITMRGLYLNGAQVKVASKRSSTILRSVGPAAQGPGDLDELHFPTWELDVPGKDSLIFAAKIVEADGILLIVRSEASFILPPQETFALIETLWGQLERISISAKKMLKLFPKAEDRQAETTANQPELRFDFEHSELIVEHWKGVSEIELLVSRKEVLHYLQELLRASGIVEHGGPQPPHPQMNSIRDGYYVEYWQRGLQDLNEVIRQSTGRPQSGTHISIRGGIKFLLGDFENALQDLDLAYLTMQGRRSTVLLERALVKCMLGRYSEAMQDVTAVVASNPNVNDIQELQTCIEQILHQRRCSRRVQCGPSNQRRQLCDPENSRVKIPDLLTGDDWHSGESAFPRIIADDITTGGSTVDVLSMRLKSPHAAQPTDVPMAFGADTSSIKLQLKLANYLETLESKPRYHVRRISFIATILEDESSTDDFANQPQLLSAEDQTVLIWQAGTESLQDDSEVRNGLTSLSQRLCPYKNISLSLFDKVTDDDDREQRIGPHPLSSYRHVSFRSAMLTKHSAPDKQVQLLYLYDGLPGDLRCLRWRSHDFVKLVLSEARPSFRVFWLVQWDVVDMLDPISDGHDATGLRIKWRSGKFHGIRRREKRKSPWIAEVRPKGLRDKIGLGSYKTPEAAARAADAGFHYYNRKRLNFLDSPSFLKQIPRDLDDKDKTEFVKKEAQRLASLTEMPSSAWIPDSQSCNTAVWNENSEPDILDDIAGHTPTEAVSVGLSDSNDLKLHQEIERQTTFSAFHGYDSSLLVAESVQAEPNGDLPQEGCEDAPAGTESRTSDGSGGNSHRGRGARTNLTMRIPANNEPHGSGRKPGTSQYYGVRFRPDLNKWVAEIRVAEWKAVDKKVWLGTFETEQAAARGVDVARKLLRCKKKHPFNLPCEKLEAYSRQIPPHLILTDLTATSTFKEVTLFIKHLCQEYVASFHDSPTGQTISAANWQSSSGGQIFNNASSINQTARGYENTSSTESSDVLDVDDHSEPNISDMILDPHTSDLEVASGGAGKLDHPQEIEPRLLQGFKKFSLEIRPPRFKKKLWFGTYTVEEIDRAKDAINYYMGCNLPFCHSDSPQIFATKPLQGIKFEDLQPSCDDSVQVGDGQELKYKYFSRQVKDVIHTVTGKAKSSSNNYKASQAETPQEPDFCDTDTQHDNSSLCSSSQQVSSTAIRVKHKKDKKIVC